MDKGELYSKLGSDPIPTWFLPSVGNFSPAMGARNQVGIGLSYLPVSLCSLVTQFQTRFLESIPRPIAGLKFSTQFLFPWRVFKNSRTS